MLGARFEQVLTAARGGDPSAWAELYRDLAPSVDRYLRARGLRDPDDVLGETMVSVVRGLHGFEGEEPAFRGWVFAIARNRATDALRWHARRPSHAMDHDALADLGPAGDAEEEAIRSLATERVRDVLSALTEDQREVLLLRLVAGLTVHEIARATDRSAGAVKMLQGRGLGALRRKISEGAVTL